MLDASSPALLALDPALFLSSDSVVQTQHPSVTALADRLGRDVGDEVEFARVAFEWVRDEVAHSFDARNPRVTLSASEVLEHRTGLCYAKAHLLTAVLRSKGIPTALCYQRLADDVGGLVVHGLVAVHLEGLWHRQDPRGNKPGVNAQFSLGTERLAWGANRELGELDYPTLYASPARCVLETLRQADDVLTLEGGGLPSSLD